jgi:hypothetical protein
VSDPAAIVCNVRHAIDVLVERDDPRLTAVAAVLTRLLAGQDFATAADLLPGWRSHLRLTARDRALDALVKMRADMNDSQLATWIMEGFVRLAACSHGSVRPDGADGYLTDLIRADCPLGWRQWRRLIADARRAGHPID